MSGKFREFEVLNLFVNRLSLFLGTCFGAFERGAIEGNFFNGIVQMFSS